MNELYWITRLDAIDTAFILFLVISSIALIATVIGYLANKCYEIDCPNDEEASKYGKMFMKYLRYFAITFTISLLGVVFVPTTKEALAIWGIGGTIDYIKANPTARQLPDKCINALDKWVDSWSEQKKDSIK